LQLLGCITQPATEFASLLSIGNVEHEHNLVEKASYCSFLLESLAFHHADSLFNRRFLSSPHNVFSSYATRPVLDGFNYPSWSSAMETFLKSQSLWRITIGNTPYPINRAAANTKFGDPIPDPSQEILEARSSWQKKNDAALSNIILCLTPPLADLI
jgi:hypothetical protein